MLSREEIKKIVEETLREINEEAEEEIEEDEPIAFFLEVVKDCLIVFFIAVCALLYALINFTNIPLDFITCPEEISAGLAVGMVIAGVTFLYRRYV